MAKNCDMTEILIKTGKEDKNTEGENVKRKSGLFVIIIVIVIFTTFDNPVIKYLI